jgi:hypothetical protein
MGEQHGDRERGHADREREEGVGRSHQLGPEDQTQQRVRREQRDEAQAGRRYREQPQGHTELTQRVLAPVRAGGGFG